MLFLAIFGVSLQAAAPTTTFAYLTSSLSYEVQLHQVDPLNPDAVIAPISIALPAKHDLSQAAFSPDGKRIAMWLRSEEYFELYLYQLGTSALDKMGQFPVWDPSGDFFDSRSIALNWSPDSRYVAFNSYDGTAINTYLLNVGDLGLVTAITGIAYNSLTGGFPLALAWSGDSTRLALVEDECHNVDIGLLCSNAIHAITIPDFKPIVQIKTEGTICHLQWSPDNRYISFERECDLNMIFYYSDVYLLSVAQGSIQRLTHLSTPSDDSFSWDNTYATARSSIWYDANTLLLGTATAKRAPVQTMPVAETAIYHPKTGRAAKLGDDVAVGWVRNPISGEFAYAAAPVTGIDGLGFSSGAGFIRIATFDGEQLSVVAQMSQPDLFRYDLKWSFDGRFVSFSNIASQGYTYSFLDKSTGEVTHFDTSLQSDFGSGWIEKSP